MTIEKLNKLFIGVIIVTVFAYVMHIIDLSLFANDFTQITSQIQMIAGFIPDQSVQQINSVIEFLNNSAGVIRTLLVTLAVLSGVASVIGLFLIKLFADRVAKYKTIFGYSGLIITAAATLYMQFKLFPTFSGLISLILIFATALMMIAAAVYIVLGVLGIYRIVMDEQFEVTDIAFDFAKVLSFIFIFYTVVIIGTKIALYMSVTVLVQEIDLASLIDVMNYIQIDWTTVLPPVLLSTGIITGDSIDLVINNLADQYILSYASTFIQNIVLAFSRSIIFNNIVAYISALFAGAAIMYTATKDYKYRHYAAIGLMVTISVIGFVYIGGLLVDILALGFVACIALIILDIFKQYR